MYLRRKNSINSLWTTYNAFKNRVVQHLFTTKSQKFKAAEKTVAYINYFNIYEAF